MPASVLALEELGKTEKKDEPMNIEWLVFGVTFVSPWAPRSR